MTTIRTTLPALSIQQPYTTAILRGVKSIELRTWGTGIRGWVLLHAGKYWYGSSGKDHPEYRHDAYLNARDQAARLGLPWDPMTTGSDYPKGGIVGIARLTKVARFSPDSWEHYRSQHRHTGLYDPETVGWHFTDARAFPLIPYRGQPGLFQVPITVLPEAIQQLVTEVAA